MDGFTDFASISKKAFDFFSKRIDLDAIFEKVISIIFISIIMYFSIRIGNKIINKFVDRQVASRSIKKRFEVYSIYNRDRIYAI